MRKKQELHRRHNIDQQEFEFDYPPTAFARGLKDSKKENAICPYKKIRYVRAWFIGFYSCDQVVPYKQLKFIENEVITEEDEQSLAFLNEEIEDYNERCRIMKINYETRNFTAIERLQYIRNIINQERRIPPFRDDYDYLELPDDLNNAA